MEVWPHLWWHLFLFIRVLFCGKHPESLLNKFTENVILCFVLVFMLCLYHELNGKQTHLSSYLGPLTFRFLSRQSKSILLNIGLEWDEQGKKKFSENNFENYIEKIKSDFFFLPAIGLYFFLMVVCKTI